MLLLALFNFEIDKSGYLLSYLDGREVPLKGSVYIIVCAIFLKE